MDKTPSYFNLLLEHENLLSPFGKLILQNFYKYVFKGNLLIPALHQRTALLSYINENINIAPPDGSHNMQSYQQTNVGPKYKKRRTLNFKSHVSENSTISNGEITFDSVSNLNNTNLSPIHEENEINTYCGTNEVTPDSIMFVNEFENEELMLNMDSNKEICKYDPKATTNVTWDNMFDTELLKITDLDISNNSMDVDNRTGLNVHDSPSNSNLNDRKKCVNKISEKMINKVLNSVVDNFDPKEVLNCFSTWRDKENTKNFKEKKLLNEVITSTTDAINKSNTIYIDECANDFSAFSGNNNVESGLSALNDDKISKNVETSNEIKDSNWIENVIIDNKPQALPKKRLRQTKLTDIIAKKVKRGNTENNMYRKQRYTKTIKNWLNDVNINNPMKLNNELKDSGTDVTGLDNKIEAIENSPENRKVKKRKIHSQTRLANKDGVMKFK